MSKIKILIKIKKIKEVIQSLKETKSLDDAINIQLIKKDISKLSRELWRDYKLDTTSLKYRCDAVSDSMGHAVANVSKDNYKNIFKHNYKRWLDECTKEKLLSETTEDLMEEYEKLLSETTEDLMEEYEKFLIEEFKKLCDKHNEKKTYQELDEADKIIFEEFIGIGCKTLTSLYNDFEKVIKAKIS